LAQLGLAFLEGVRGTIPETNLEAVVLGGGYGRGEGGVLQTARGDRPYNDIDFYVFVKGNRLLAERKFGPRLRRVCEELSADAGVHVEFKLENLHRFQNEPISMFSYDLVWGHQVLFGEWGLFDDAPRHFRSADIPVAEATRLLFNRCSGLLLAREHLIRGQLNDEQADFVARNIAKARLALGDAVLTVFGLYHWSCLERHSRMWQIGEALAMPWLPAVRQHHAAGVEFKLHPDLSRTDFEAEHCAVADLARKVWLWVEGRRLNRVFSSVQEYAECRAVKCPGVAGWRNLLLNLHSFGLSAALEQMAWRYPRERLFNCLPLLLWEPDLHEGKKAARHVQKQLHTTAADWEGLVSAYKSVWPAYG
jgi:hypothetical protein